MALDAEAKSVGPEYDAHAPADPKLAFKDDSGLVRGIRKLDRVVGFIEHLILFGLLLLILFAGLASIIKNKLVDGRPIEGIDELTRYAVFGIAMVGGAYATHLQRLLAMDLVTKMISVKLRALLRTVMALFAASMAGLMFWGGLRVHTLKAADNATGVLTPAHISLFIALGAGLIAFHLLMQALIDLDYIFRGKTAPEPEHGAI